MLGCDNNFLDIIDTPGHVDFTAEVERSLRVLDGAVAVICAVDGVQPQTETVWKQADSFSVPRLVYMNKMDRIGADYFGSIEDVQNKFGVECVALQIPIGQGQDFEGIIDLLKMKELRFEGDEGGLLRKAIFLPKDLMRRKNGVENLLTRSLRQTMLLRNFILRGKRFLWSS